MDPFSLYGSFWLPDEPGRRIAGMVTFDGQSMQVTLYNSLRPFEMPEEGVVSSSVEWVEEGILWGRLHEEHVLGQDFTLGGVAGYIIPGPFDVVSEDYSVSRALFGVHTNDVAVGRLLVSFDALEAWTNPPQLVSSFGTGGTITARGVGSQITLHEATYGEIVYRLVTVGEGHWGDDIHVDRKVYIEVLAPQAPVPLDLLLSTWVRPIHDYLIVCLGEQVAITRMKVGVVDVHGRDMLADLVTPAIQSTPSTRWTVSGVRSQGSRTLLTPDDALVPFRDSLPGWLEVRSELGDAITLLCAPYYASFMYSENKYASFFQAAEALAKAVFETAELPRDQHRERVSGIIRAATDARRSDADIEWARRILSARNDLPLRTLISELFLDADQVGSRILDALPDAPKDITGARAGVSHGGGTSTSSLRRYWLGELLVWLLRYHLVREIGLPPDVIGARAWRARDLQRALNELRE